MYRFLLTAALVAALATGAGIWLDGRLRETRRQEQHDLERQVELELGKLISLEEIAGSDRTFLEVLRHVAGQLDVPIVFNRAKLEDEIAFDRPEISVPRAKLTVRSVLGLLSHQVPIEYYSDRGRLVITTRDHAEGILFTRIYPLPQTVGQGKPVASDADKWIEVLTYVVDPDSWDDVGGPGEATEIPGALVIRQTWQNHERLRQFFQQLEQASSNLDAQADYLAAYSPAETRIHSALEGLCDFQCAGSPLLEVLEDLSRKHHIPIAPCQPKLDEAAIDLKTPLTLKMKGATLRAALHSLLEQAELAYVISDDVLQVTTPEDAGSRMRTVVYDVRDLVIVKEGIDFDFLIELITTTVNPDSWDDTGGPGSLQDLPPYWLALRQSDSMHADVALLLSQIRAALRQRDGEHPAPLQPPPAEQKIAAALDREIKLDYQGLKLQQVASDLAERTGVNVRLDERNLNEAAVPTDTPISCHIPSLPLKLALRQLLEDEHLAEAGLAWTMRDECLVLTTNEVANYERELLVLDVRGLAGQGEENVTFDEDYLAQLLQTSFQSEFQNLGDNCSFFEGLLVVAAPREIDTQMQNLMVALEQYRDESLLARQKGTTHIKPFSIEVGEANLSPDALLMRINPVEDLLGSEGSLAMDELRIAVTDIVSPDTWTEMGGPGEIVCVPPGGLLVFQNRDEHQQVQRFLDELRQVMLPKLPPPPWLLSRDKQRQILSQALSSREQLLFGLTRMNELQQALTRMLKQEVALDAVTIPFGFQDLPSVPNTPPRNLPKTVKEQLAGLGMIILVKEQGFVLTRAEEDQRLAFYDVSDLLARNSPFEVNELCSIFDGGLVDDNTPQLSNGPTAYFRGWLMIRSREERLKMLDDLLAWLRQQPDLPRARTVHKRQDPVETGQLIRRLLDTKSAEEQLYLAFVLQFAAPPEHGLDDLAAQVDSLSDVPDSLVALRLRDVVHRWVVTLPSKRLEVMFDTSPSPLLRKAAIQTLASRGDASQSGFDTVLEAVESRILARPELSAKEIDELRFAVEQRFMPSIHRGSFDVKLLFDPNPTSASRNLSPVRTLRIYPWRQPRSYR
jgi:hypothetical protein